MVRPCSRPASNRSWQGAPKLAPPAVAGIGRHLTARKPDPHRRVPQARRLIATNSGLENGRAAAHICRMEKKRPWKIIAYTERLGGGLGSQEYFIVRELNPHAAIATLQTVRTDLLDTRCEVKGEASADFLDWLQVDQDVFSIMVLS
jgi:hypothetical protein